MSVIREAVAAVAKEKLCALLNPEAAEKIAAAIAEAVEDPIFEALIKTLRTNAAPAAGAKEAGAKAAGGKRLLKTSIFYTSSEYLLVCCSR